MIGSQIPTICVEPHRVTTDGPDAAFLMAEYANPLDPWQSGVVDSWLAKDEEGQYIVTSAGLSVPRQNGKNVCLEAREIYGMLINGERILHTAHQVKTSKKSFRRLESIFTNTKHPEILKEVKNIRYTNGEECIELKNGATIEFATRSRQAARGFDGMSLLVYDEAQELTDDQIEATMPILAASSTGFRQIIYTGTPPYPGCPGVVFRRRRNTCLNNPGPGDSWHEWGVVADSIDDIDVTDKKLWYMMNPALGIHITEEFVENELKTMSKDGFARERLNWWMPEIENKQQYVIDKAAWNACKSEEKKPEGKTAYGIKFTPDGSEVVLSGAVCPQNGKARVTEIERRPTGLGTRWLSEWLNARYNKASCVVIDGRNGVDTLVDRISDVWKAKGSVIRPTTKEVIAAASLLTEEVNEKTVTWFSGQEDLKESAITSIKRPIGGGWGFGGENSAPIESAALALWGARTSNRDPNRKMRVG